MQMRLESQVERQLEQIAGGCKDIAALIQGLDSRIRDANEISQLNHKRIPGARPAPGG